MKPRSERPRRATADYIAKLLATVEKAPRVLGLAFSNWTMARLAQYLTAQPGIELSPRQVENYLKADDRYLRRLAGTVKHKQDFCVGGREKKAILAQMAKANPDLVLLFRDSAEVSLLPTITPGVDPEGLTRRPRHVYRG